MGPAFPWSLLASERRAGGGGAGGGVGEAADLDAGEVVGAEADGGGELEVVVAGERLRLRPSHRVVAHNGGRDGVGADGVAAGDQEMRLHRLQALVPGALAAGHRLDALDDRQV